MKCPKCPECNEPMIPYEFVSGWDEDGNEIEDQECVCPSCTDPSDLPGASFVEM
jgi:hypothetical protein